MSSHLLGLLFSHFTFREGFVIVVNKVELLILKLGLGEIIVENPL